MRIFFAALVFSSIASSARAAEQPAAVADFVVATSGDDANAGTLAEPFATIDRARQAVRQLIATGLNSDVKVCVRQGVYRPSEPLTFGPEDSGDEQHAVTYAAYPDETVVISG